MQNILPKLLAYLACFLSYLHTFDDDSTIPIRPAMSKETSSTPKDIEAEKPITA